MCVCSYLFIHLFTCSFLLFTDTTIALASAHQIRGTVVGTVTDLLGAIIEALTAEEFDYWGEVEADVVDMVGEYVNAQNMVQVRIYQEDLVDLMYR